MTAYGPLGCTPIPALVGRKGAGPLDDPTVSLSTRSHYLSLTSIQIISIAEQYDKTPAQIILCFMINRGVSVIPKSNSLDRIATNFDCLFELADSDFATIDCVLGSLSEPGVRNLQSNDYLGFDNYNEDVEEP